jgi:hypothetical protein
MVLPIGLPPKMAKFCHTSNRFLMARGCCHALLQLYFYSSVVGWSVGWSVGQSVGHPQLRWLGFSRFPSKMIKIINFTFHWIARFDLKNALLCTILGVLTNQHILT